jgi:hypothetical protein
MLKQVQHDVTIRFLSFCYPEPGPERASGSKDFGISILGLRVGCQSPRRRRGSLFPESYHLDILLDRKGVEE